MDVWESIKWALDWGGRIQLLINLIKVFVSLGLAEVVTVSLHSRIPAQWSSAVWYFSIAAFLALFAYGFPWLPRKWSKTKKLEHSGGETVTEKPPQWFFDMITEDQTRMPQKLKAVKWEPWKDLDGTDPYIDFNVTFVNASVFDLNKPETIRGNVKFRNRSLTSPPRLEKQFVVAMPRGTHSWLKIRQHLSPGMAAEMKEAISVDAATILDFSEVSITFTGHCDGIANTTFEWVAPYSVSFKDITAFATA